VQCDTLRRKRPTQTAKTPPRRWQADAESTAPRRTQGRDEEIKVNSFSRRIGVRGLLAATGEWRLENRYSLLATSLFALLYFFPIEQGEAERRQTLIRILRALRHGSHL